MNIYKLKGTSGSVVNQSFPLGDKFVLGAADDCDVQIQEPGVAQHHAEIELVDGNALRLTDLGSNQKTLLNGEPVKQAMLGSGDEIRIGSCRWMLQAPGLRPERVLTADVIAKSSRIWPRVVVWTILGATAAAVAVIQFKPEWIAAWWP
jgi:hypothetical protein